MMHPSAAHDAEGFQLRGTEVSRVEAFSDVVFGFAITLLVVSLEVPKSFAQLQEALRGFAPFAISFWLLFSIWLEHFRFFRRYGLQDSATIRINAVLLFVIVFYVYPLKFLFLTALGTVQTAPMLPVQRRELMLLFALGYAAVNVFFGLLYANAWRQRRSLALSRHEELLTRAAIVDCCIAGGIGLFAGGLACIVPANHIGSSGWTYLLLAVYRPVSRAVTRRSLRRPAYPGARPAA